MSLITVFALIKIKPRKAFVLLEFVSLFATLSWMRVSTNLMIDSFIFVSFLFDIEETFLSIFLISVVNSTADIFGTIALTKSGFETMAFMAIIPSQFFNLTNGIGINLLGSKNYYFNIFGLFISQEHVG